VSAAVENGKDVMMSVTIGQKSKAAAENKRFFAAYRSGSG
jgi:hypothetical protein